MTVEPEPHEVIVIRHQGFEMCPLPVGPRYDGWSLQSRKQEDESVALP
jgi:hypothetical protein